MSITKNANLLRPTRWVSHVETINRCPNHGRRPEEHKHLSRCPRCHQPYVESQLHKTKPVYH